MASPRLTTKAAEAAKPIKGKQAAHPDAQVPGLGVADIARRPEGLEFPLSEQGRAPTPHVARSVPGRGRGRCARQGVQGAGVAGRWRRPGERATEGQGSRPEPRGSDVWRSGRCLPRTCKAGIWRPKNKTKRASTLATETAVLKKHIRPRLGSLDLSDVTRRRIRTLLTDMTKAGIGARANKTHAIIRQVCAYGISEEHLILNPAMGFPPPADQKARARVLTDEELGEWWAALKDPSELRLPLKEGRDRS